VIEETKLPPRGIEAIGLCAALSRRGRRLYREGKTETLDGSCRRLRKAFISGGGTYGGLAQRVNICS
jgi:hypothetical protein